MGVEDEPFFPSKKEFLSSIGIEVSVFGSPFRRSAVGAVSTSYVQHPFFQETAIEGSVFNFFVLSSDQDNSVTKLEVLKLRRSHTESQVMFRLTLKDAKSKKLSQMECNNDDTFEIIACFCKQNPNFVANACLVENCDAK